MTREIARQRLHTQGLIDQSFKTPAEAVAWLGAVQSQDYSGAKWAVGQRIAGADDALVEQAMTEGFIIRTHILRPTWHFVAAPDLRWMLTATAPRVHALNAYYYRKMELDETVFAKSQTILTQALQGGKHLTRAEIAKLYREAGIVADELRLAYLVMHAELEGLICSGPHRGKQFTYALIDERVPPSKSLTQDEAIAELTRRYFTGHGPATIQDFAWWSSLSVAEITTSLESVKSQLHHEEIDGVSYWWGDTPSPLPQAVESPIGHLLPNYDELLGSYRGRSATIDDQYVTMWDGRNIVFAHYLVIDGRVLGTWKRDLKKKDVIVTAKPFRPLSDGEQQVITDAAAAFGAFLGLQAGITFE